ncbi:Protein unc-13 A [Willisornis vidua]|uniref:Protein unc-13 A n=1 Tax=Willisornis vidua TaxID=1566151 RepID=A0ABQ9CXH5_9PASS|nr:Protein unc-13 A [Willisornis vidua]
MSALSDTAAPNLPEEEQLTLDQKIQKDCTANSNTISKDSEICADGTGFIVELWKKGLLWDSILGVLWIPLQTVEYATDEGPGSWWTLNSEVIKNGTEIQGTKTPTSHEILLDVYFALPFGPELNYKILLLSEKFAILIIGIFKYYEQKDYDCFKA